MIKKVLFVITVLLFLLSCNQNNKTVDSNLTKLGVDSIIVKEIPLLIHYYRYSKVNITDSIRLSKFQENSIMNYIFISGEDTLLESFMKPVNSDSSIYTLRQNCPLIAQKIFIINGIEYNILKYYYDIESSFDEEQSFFYHKDYGTLVCYDEGWGNIANTMEYDAISKQLVDSIINDRTGFFEDKIPPPPMSFIDFKPDTSIWKISLLNSDSIDNVLRQIPLDSHLQISILNKNKSQILKLTMHPGNVKFEFSEFNIKYNVLNESNVLTIMKDEFITENNIKLGISIEELVDIKGYADSISEGNTQLIYHYRIDDLDSSNFLQYYNMPLYYANYYFKNNKLIEFKFGFEYP